MSNTKGHVTHGMHGTRAYRSWQAMKARCTYSYMDNWQYYGGAGINFCPEWATFEGFFRDMGECPDDHSLDRIDPSGDYCPSNCRWASKLAQANNTKAVKNVTFNGETHSVAEWSRRSGIKYSTLYHRLFKYNMTVEKAFER